MRQKGNCSTACRTVDELKEEIIIIITIIIIIIIKRVNGQMDI